MNNYNVRKFINSATQTDLRYVARRAKITYEYLVYHIGTGRKAPSEETAALIEKGSISLNKRKPHVPVVRCFDLIDSYKTCPHGLGDDND